MTCVRQSLFKLKDISFFYCFKDNCRIKNLHTVLQGTLLPYMKWTQRTVRLRTTIYETENVVLCGISIQYYLIVENDVATT